MKEKLRETRAKLNLTQHPLYCPLASSQCQEGLVQVLRGHPGDSNPQEPKWEETGRGSPPLCLKVLGAGRSGPAATQHPRNAGFGSPWDSGPKGQVEGPRPDPVVPNPGPPAPFPKSLDLHGGQRHAGPVYEGPPVRSPQRLSTWKQGAW